MTDESTEMQDELLTEKIEAIKEMITQAAETYSNTTSNSFLKTPLFQQLIIDRFLDLDNILSNTDKWSKEEILEMAALFMLMSIDPNMEETDDDSIMDTVISDEEEV